VLVAIGTVKLLRGTRFKGMSSAFVMELPPYRMPTLRSLLLHTWERAWLYLRKAGTIILGISIVMWFLMSFPDRTSYSNDNVTAIQQADISSSPGEISNKEIENIKQDNKSAIAAERLKDSFAGHIGRFIEPIIKPLGFDWRLGIALISGFAAKETVVSTMATIYGVSGEDKGSESLRQKLAGDPKYSKLKAYAFLAFILLYVPCMAAMAVFLRETRSWKELLFQLSYTTVLAWTISLVIYQGGRLIGLG
jgi:ferrous iron transport protein B